ncbi:MAG TPA: hypothetical protein VF544_09640 [Pyrinomonadaceae bacterium]|jgi:hypothetical protein
MKSICLKSTLLSVLAVFSASLCFSNAVSNQLDESKTPILLGRCVGNCLYDTLSQEYAFAIADAANHGKIAIRLCSNERFEIAVAKASDNLVALTDVLKKQKHVNTENIALLLSNDCLIGGSGRVATEFWAIAPSAPLPSHESNIRLKNASITVIREGNYRSNTKEFIDRLRQQPDSYGVVIGSFFRQPSSTLKIRVRKTRIQLKKYPDLKGRYAIDLIPYGVSYTGYIEPIEPDFLIIHLSKERDLR